MFKTQTLLTITLDCNYDISTATQTRILYKKPSGVKGHWNASVAGTTLIYPCVNGEIDQEGVWRFQAKVIIGGLTAYGRIVKQTFDLTIE